MANEKRLIDANELLDIGHKTKLIEVFPEWKELPSSAQKAVCKYGGWVKKMIQQLPTVEAVEVVHGHWDEGVNHGYCCCSKCRDVYILEEWLTDGKWNYCPNCGAKMDGDGNG